MEYGYLEYWEHLKVMSISTCGLSEMGRSLGHINGKHLDDPYHPVVDIYIFQGLLDLA